MHTPVLKKEVLEYLDPRPNENFIDCTGGEGGHTFAIIEMNFPKGKVLAMDKDSRNISKIGEGAKNQGFSERIILFNDNYSNVNKAVKKSKIDKFSGILFDLGYSSWHIDESGRGFSFRKNEKLDMRYDEKDEITAWEIVNSWPKPEIEKILKDYGEERFFRSITQGIIDQRKKEKINTTFDLVKVIESSVPGSYRRKKIHCATKTFQALRITVNRELENVKLALPQAIEVLEGGGRIVVISFHSLEDRIIKNFFKEKALEGKLKILTKRPVIAGEEERNNNPRSRSAKLRVAIKL